MVQRLKRELGVAREHAEIDLGVGVVGRELNRLQRHQPHARVFELARNELAQVALNLIGDLEAAVGGGFFARHGGQAR